MTHRQVVTDELRAIPAHRWRYKVGRLIIAAGLVALLYFVAIPKDWSVGVDLGIAVAAGYCISEDLTRAIMRFIVATIRDVLAAIKNGKSDDRPTG